MLALQPRKAGSSACCAPSPAYLDPRPPTLRQLAWRLRDFRSLFMAGAAEFILRNSKDSALLINGHLSKAAENAQALQNNVSV